MILNINQYAPDFAVNSIDGKEIQLSAFQGSKILLSFYRHVGCPVHHLRFQELCQYDEEFKCQNLIVLAIYESTRTNLLSYSDTSSHYAVLIANPAFNLYERYGIELSTIKLLTSMYNGVHCKRVEGEKLMKQKFEPEGHHNLLGGDFLINEEGILKRSYYNQYLGDHLPIAEIRSFINDPCYTASYEPRLCC